jgi:hypothetical protein
MIFPRNRNLQYLFYCVAISFDLGTTTTVIDLWCYYCALFEVRWWWLIGDVHFCLKPNSDISQPIMTWGLSILNGLGRLLTLVCLWCFILLKKAQDHVKKPSSIIIHHETWNMMVQLLLQTGVFCFLVAHRSSFISHCSWQTSEPSWNQSSTNGARCNNEQQWWQASSTQGQE